MWEAVIWDKKHQITRTFVIQFVADCFFLWLRCLWCLWSLGVKRWSSKLFSYDHNHSGLLKMFSSSFLTTGTNYLMSPKVDWSAPSGKPTVHFTTRISSCSGPETVRFPDSNRLISALLCTHLWRCAGICTSSVDEWENSSMFGFMCG